MLCNSLNTQRRRKVYLRLNAYYSAVISAIWPLNGAGKFDFLCDFTMNGRREVYLRLNAYYSAIISAFCPSIGARKFICDWMPLNFLKFCRSALELYFSSLRRWILLKFRIQHPNAIDKLTVKGHQNTLTEWGEINCFVRPSGLFDELKFQHFIIFSSLHWILKIVKF